MTTPEKWLDAAALDLLHDENAHDLLGNYPEVISQARAALALRDELAAAKKQESAQTTAAQRAWLAADTLRNELAECQQKHAACDDCLDNTKAELAECRALVQLHMDDSAVNAREADDLRAKLAQAEQERDEARNANLSVRVCRNHTSEVIGEGCLVCDLAASLRSHDAEVLERACMPLLHKLANLMDAQREEEPRSLLYDTIQLGIVDTEFDIAEIRALAAQEVTK